MRFLTVFRTYSWDECIGEMARKARDYSQGGDFIVSADFSRGSFPTSDFECIGHTETEISEFGLPIVPKDRALWHNWDYICPIILSWKKEKYDYYVVTESDVAVNLPISLLCQKMQEENIDLIVDFIHKPTPEWIWYKDALTVSDNPLGCLLCVSIFSHKALELITNQRLKMAADYADGTRTIWPFCETVVPATIRDAGLKIADLKDFANLSHFHFGEKYSEHNPVVNEPGGFVHSVISGKKIIDLTLSSRPIRNFIDELPSNELSLLHENQADIQKSIINRSLNEPDYAATAFFSRNFNINIYTKNNVAQYKPVATSSLSIFSQSHIASEADNLTNPMWTGEFSFHTDCEHNPWVVVDLLEKTFLKSLLIENRHLHSERFDDFTIETSLDSEIWRTESFELSNHPTDKTIFVTFRAPPSARFLRITSLSNDCLHLRSLKAQSLPLGSTQDLSPYAIADMSTVSSYSQSDDTQVEASSLFVGADDYSIHSKNEPYPWWKAEFDRLVVIERVRISIRSGWNRRFIRFAFETSTDGKIWTVIRLVMDGKSPSEAPQNEVIWSPSNPAATRYFRIRLLENGILNLQQIELSGRPAL